MEIFWIVWMFILPVLGLTLAILAPLFWFIIVPKLARTITWNKFRNIVYLLLGDEWGYAHLLTAGQSLPEAVIKTEKGWRLSPVATHKTSEMHNLEDLGRVMGEKIALKRYLLKGLGKPILLGYAGKVTTTNFGTLAGLQQTEHNPVNPSVQFNEIHDYAKDLPGHFRKPLTKMLTKLEEAIKSEPITYIDPRVLMEVLPEMRDTPSQLDAIKTYSEMVGREEGGKGYGKLILGMGFILGMVIIAIVAIAVLMK